MIIISRLKVAHSRGSITVKNNAQMSKLPQFPEHATKQSVQPVANGRSVDHVVTYPQDLCSHHRQ